VTTTPTTPSAARASAPLVVLSAATVLFTLLFLLAPSAVRPRADYNDFEAFYRPVAENLVEGRGYTGADGEPELHNPPGYPFILAGLFWLADVTLLSQESALSAFTALAMGVACALVFLLARELFSPRVAWVAAALWVTYPITLLMALYKFSEVPFTVVLLLTTLLFVRWTRSAITVRRALVLGALVGVATLIRPAAILLAVPLLVGLWVWKPLVASRSRRTLAAALLAANLLVLLPWEVWAWVRTDRVILLSTAGNRSMTDGLTVGQRPRDETGSTYIPGDVDDLMADIARETPAAATFGQLSEPLGEAVRERPFTVMKLVAFKAARAWYGTNQLRYEAIILPLQLAYLALVAIGAALAWRRGTRSRSAVLFVALVVGYSWLMALTVLSIVRYLAPATALLFPFAGLAVVALAERWRRPRRASPSRRAEPAPSGASVSAG